MLNPKSAKSSSILVLLVLAVAAVAIIPLTLTYGQSESKLTVTSEDSNGNSITGFETTLYSGNESVLATGFTPAVFTLDNGQAYGVQVDDYGNCRFDHWMDTSSTNSSRTISISNDTQITAIYNCGVGGQNAGNYSSSVTIDSVNQNGSAISGYYVVLYDANGSVAATGTTPETFPTALGRVYIVQVQDYGSSCTFNRWSTGITDSSMKFNMTSASLDFTATYDCGSAASPSVSLVQQSGSTCSYVCENGSTTTTFSSDVRGGDMLAVTVVSDDLTNLNVSDSLGTAIQLGVRSTSTSCDSNTGTCQADIYWGMFPASGADSVTVREGASDRALRVQIWELSEVNAIAGGSCGLVSYPADSILLATGRDAYGSGTGFTWSIYDASAVAGSEYQVSQSSGSTTFPFSTGVNDVEAAAVFLQSPASIECGSGSGTTTTTTSTSSSTASNSTMAAYRLSIGTDKAAYTENESMVISGSVSPPPATPTNVIITISGPDGPLAVSTRPVNATSGSYSYDTVAGGGNWVPGKYTVTGVWDALGQHENATASFVFGPPA